MKTIILGLCAMVLFSGCATKVEVSPVGNEYAQHGYSRNFWWPNWDRTIFCEELDANGFCPKKGGEKHTVTAMQASGQEAAVGALKNSPLAFMGFGFPRNRFSQTFESNGINQAYISTLNTPAGQFPWAK